MKSEVSPPGLPFLPHICGAIRRQTPLALGHLRTVNSPSAMLVFLVLLVSLRQKTSADLMSITLQQTTQGEKISLRYLLSGREPTGSLSRAAGERHVANLTKTQTRHNAKNIARKITVARLRQIQQRVIYRSKDACNTKEQRQRWLSFWDTAIIFSAFYGC